MKQKYIRYLLVLSVLNILVMHYTIFHACNIERQIDSTVYVDNLCMVVCEVYFLFLVLSFVTKGNVRIMAFISSLLTLLWSFCNVVYARFFFQYISVSAIGECGNLLDSYIFKCLVDGIRWTDLYYLGSMFISFYLYRKVPVLKLSLLDLMWGFLVVAIAVVIDIAGHAVYCVSSPTMRYLSYYKHRLSMEWLSPQCYSAQPVYANFQRGNVRSLGYGIIENLSGTMMLTDIQKKIIQEEIDDLKPVQECAKAHPDIRNVIFVLVESYMSFTVNMKVKGKEVTPFLNSLYRDSTVYYNGQMEPNITLGESSDGQFIYMTGLLPLRSAITVTKAKKYSYPALPKQVAMAKRIHTQMVIPTAPSMWNQDVMCERYGVESLYSTSDYKKPHSMYLSDDQVVDLADSVNIVSKQPFFSMVLTFSMHQPYVDKIDPLFNVYDENFSVSLNNYLNACHFTDRQLRRYFDGLKEQGLYDQSLIIIASDHHVGSSALELPDSLADRHLPLFIINGGEDMSKAWKGECNQLDVYTTILDLLNIKSTWRGLGHSLLSSDYKNSVTVKKWDISEWIIKSGFFNDKKN